MWDIASKMLKMLTTSQLAMTASNKESLGFVKLGSGAMAALQGCGDKVYLNEES